MLVVITHTLTVPYLTTALIDAEAFHMAAVIVFSPPFGGFAPVEGLAVCFETVRLQCLIEATLLCKIIL